MKWSNRRGFAIIMRCVLLTVAVMIVFYLGFGLGAVRAEERNELWRDIVITPEPAQCSLCDHLDELTFEAPVLLDLASGEIGELSVSESGGSQLETQVQTETNGTFQFLVCAGIVAVRDTDNGTCKVILQEENKKLEPEYYCYSCRCLVAKCDTEGYLLLDIDDTAMRPFPVEEGATMIIKNCTVTIDRNESSNGLVVEVKLDRNTE